MQPVQNWSGSGINSRHVAAIVLALLVHIAFWQLLRLQNAGILRYENSSIVQYLQLFNAAKPALPAKPETRHQASLPEKGVARDSAFRKRQAATVMPSEKLLEITPEPITAPSKPTTDIDNNTSSAPALDLGALRSSALNMERRRKPTEMEQMQARNSVKPTLEQRLGDGVKRAEKKDCLKAYSGIGLFGVIPLVASTVVDTGCKW